MDTFQIFWITLPCWTVGQSDIDSNLRRPKMYACTNLVDVLWTKTEIYIIGSFYLHYRPHSALIGNCVVLRSK